jgi:hypothetical protein
MLAHRTWQSLVLAGPVEASERHLAVGSYSPYSRGRQYTASVLRGPQPRMQNTIKFVWLGFDSPERRLLRSPNKGKHSRRWPRLYGTKWIVQVRRSRRRFDHRWWRIPAPWQLWLRQSPTTPLVHIGLWPDLLKWSHNLVPPMAHRYACYTLRPSELTIGRAL